MLAGIISKETFDVISCDGLNFKVMNHRLNQGLQLDGKVSAEISTYYEYSSGSERTEESTTEAEYLPCYAVCLIGTKRLGHSALSSLTLALRARGFQFNEIEYQCNFEMP
eukprot:sb/3477343/